MNDQWWYFIGKPQHVIHIKINESTVIATCWKTITVKIENKYHDVLNI